VFATAWRWRRRPPASPFAGIVSATQGGSEARGCIYGERRRHSLKQKRIKKKTQGNKLFWKLNKPKPRASGPVLPMSPRKKSKENPSRRRDQGETGEIGALGRRQNDANKMEEGTLREAASRTDHGQDRRSILRKKTAEKGFKNEMHIEGKRKKGTEISRWQVLDEGYGESARIDRPRARWL